MPLYILAHIKAKEFKIVTQNETSITLHWNKVDVFLNYTLKYSLNHFVTVPPLCFFFTF